MSIENKKCDCCDSPVDNHLTLVGDLEVCDACLEALVKTTTVDALGELNSWEKCTVFQFVQKLVNKTVLGKQD